MARHQIVPPPLSFFACWNCVYWNRKAQHIGECKHEANAVMWKDEAQRLTTDFASCGGFEADDPTPDDLNRGHREPEYR